MTFGVDVNGHLFAIASRVGIRATGIATEVHVHSAKFRVNPAARSDNCESRVNRQMPFGHLPIRPGELPCLSLSASRLRSRVQPKFIRSQFTVLLRIRGHVHSTYSGGHSCAPSEQSHA